MKKGICMAAAAVLILSMLTGCGSGSSSAAKETTAAAGEGTTAAAQAETTAAQAEASGDAVVLKLSELNSELTSQYRYDERFAELVKEKTGGSVVVDVYANGQLSSQDPEAVTTGICDILQCIPSNWSDYYSEIAAVDAPYAIISAEESTKVMATPDSPVLQRANEALKDSNVIWLGGYFEGAREMTTTDKEIKKLEDLQGLKMRVPDSELYIELFKAFGCEATPMAWSEVASGLITGVIDGQENPITGYKEDSIQELQKYVILTHHLPANYGLWMNRSVFDKLTADQQTAVIEACCEASDWMAKDREAALAECRKELEADGMIFIGEEEGLDLASFEEAAMTVYDKYADQWGDMVDIISQTRGR